MTCMRAWMSSKFGRIRPRTTEWEKRYHIFLNDFDWIHFILAGNDDIHKSLNEF